MLVPRVNQSFELNGKTGCIREAFQKDAPAILRIFQDAYGGKYPHESGSDPRILQAEIADEARNLWLIAELGERTIGAMMFARDENHRLGKAAGAVVAQEFRKSGLGSQLLKAGVHYLTEVSRSTDVVYGTTRTISLGPSRLVSDAGFKKLGLFPNAVEIENMEHLNLDVYLTPTSLELRRRKPCLFTSFADVYSIARRQLGLESPYIISQRAPLRLSQKRIAMTLTKDQATGRSEVAMLFRKYKSEGRISNSFFPFHTPNWLLTSEDGGTQVFVWYGGMGRQAAIVGYRSDRVDTHDLLNSVAYALQAQGAAYLELLVNAYDPRLQQEAYTARFIPSAYFPGLQLAADGMRDDYFVLSRTFRLLDFNDAFVPEENCHYLQAYLKSYYELYIQPILSSTRRTPGLRTKPTLKSPKIPKENQS